MTPPIQKKPTQSPIYPGGSAMAKPQPRPATPVAIRQGVTPPPSSNTPEPPHEPARFKITSLEDQNALGHPFGGGAARVHGVVPKTRPTPTPATVAPIATTTRPATTEVKVVDSSAAQEPAMEEETETTVRISRYPDPQDETGGNGNLMG